MINDVLLLVISWYADFYLFLASILGSYGFAAILLSVMVSVVMVYPQRWAGKIARKEQDIQGVIAPQVALIKRDSSGAEQHARIHALYSRYAYHPIFAVRLIVGLFVQLPLLVLSFVMFEGLEVLNGESFLFLGDLGRADGLLYAKGNLLPFLMTAINLAAALFVARFSRKDFTQATFVSLLFFALLYNAKSILLLFWTTNNAILLFRNISSFSKNRGTSTFAFRAFWLKLQLFILRKEVLVFFVVFFLYAQLLLLVFTESFNEVLTKAFSAVTIAVLLGLAVSHAVLHFMRVSAKVYRINDRRKLLAPAIKASDILFVLIPLALVVQYALLNQELLTVTEQLQFVLIGGFVLFFVIWLLPIILERIFPVLGLVPLGVTLAVFYVSMPTIVVKSSWVENPDLALLGISFMVVFGLFLHFYVSQRRMLHSLCVVFFVVSTAYTGYKMHALENTAGANPYLEKISSIDFSNFIPATSMEKKPDVFLLTYDGYVGQETMQQYGIDNAAQEKLLRSHGFKIYPHAYSVGHDSAASMSRVLEMSSDLVRPRLFSMAGNALVPAIFKKQGYVTHGVLDSYFLMNNVGYDFSFPSMEENHSVGLISLFEGLKEGQFRFDLINKPRSYQRSEWLAKKRSILAAQTDYPKFMYTHTGPWHSQNSGTCLENETELFRQRLDVANAEMTRDVETIFASNRDAIIIINGDHGPYLTGDCHKLNNLASVEEVTQLHLQDRIGTFLAIRWPDKPNENYDKIRTLQDTFEAVFKYLFEVDTVLRRRPDTSTTRSGKNMPEGAVEDGVIRLGADKGKRLFDK